MVEPDDAFLDAAVRAFGDNAELQVIARRELVEAIQHSPEAGDSLEAMRSRFASVDSRPRRSFSWLLAVVLVASVLIAGWTTLGFYRQRDEIRWFNDLGSFSLSNMPEEKLAAGLSRAQRQLLFGDSDARPEADRMKSLWLSAPDNPVYLAEHARTWVAKDKSLPPEVLEAALKLEPDNGYIHHLAAVAVSTDCLEDVTKPVKRGEPMPLAEFKIRDEVRWRQALDHLHAVAAAPAYESHERELLRQRMALLPAPDDILSLAPVYNYLFGTGRITVHDFHLHWVIAAKARECLERKDREDFLKLLESWDRLMARSLTRNPSTLLRLVILRGSMVMPLDNFIAAADGLELPEVATELRARKERLSRDHSPLKKAMNHEEANRQAKLYGGLFQDYSFHLEIPAEEELRPSRLSEYALFDRFTAVVAWLVFALMALLTGCYRFRVSGAVRRVSRRLADLVTPRDLAWIVGAGVALPFLLSLAVVHFTPLGARGWSLDNHGGMVVAGQLFATVLLMLLTPLALARQRLGQRAGRLGLATRAPHFGWYTVAACALALPLFGIAQWVVIPEPLMGAGELFDGMSWIELAPWAERPPGRTWLWIALWLLALAAGYGLVSMSRSLFSRRQHLLRRMVLSRLLFPASLAGSLIFSISMPLYHAVERHWLARDGTATLLPGDSGLTRAEVKLLKLEEAQLLEALQPTR